MQVHRIAPWKDIYAHIFFIELEFILYICVSTASPRAKHSIHRKWMLCQVKKKCGFCLYIILGKRKNNVLVNSRAFKKCILYEKRGKGSLLKKVQWSLLGTNTILLLIKGLKVNIKMGSKSVLLLLNSPNSPIAYPLLCLKLEYVYFNFLV